MLDNKVFGDPDHIEDQDNVQPIADETLVIILRMKLSTACTCTCVVYNQ